MVVVVIYCCSKEGEDRGYSRDTLSVFKLLSKAFGIRGLDSGLFLCFESFLRKFEMDVSNLFSTFHPPDQKAYDDATCAAIPTRQATITTYYFLNHLVRVFHVCHFW
jgi:hypothetical protein